ncbi:MAG: hypothetical protein FJW23_04890 [Acidimicrobiia bacterium]|nr:hypothetical protein [Acidimicrobiia bacterium]
MKRWAAGLAVVLGSLAAEPAEAQSGAEFLPRTVFRMDAAHLWTDDIRLTWDADLSGEIDLVLWDGGRATFFANYEVVLGDELRRFDPNQGNYTLTGSVSQRAAGMEWSAVFHHVSRHLSDRPKAQAVDWNMVGVRVRREAAPGRLHMAMQADVRGTVARSFVDYTREFEARVETRYPLGARVALVSGASLRVVGVAASGGRGTQTGGRGEVGVRLAGEGGAVTLFVAAERRVDPLPLEFGRMSWVAAGFRLSSRDGTE